MDSPPLKKRARTLHFEDPCAQLTLIKGGYQAMKVREVRVDVIIVGRMDIDQNICFYCKLLGHLSRETASTVHTLISVHSTLLLYQTTQIPMQLLLTYMPSKTPSQVLAIGTIYAMTNKDARRADKFITKGIIFMYTFLANLLINTSSTLHLSKFCN